MIKNIEIVDQFQITGRGTIAFVKHQENSLKSGTILQDQHGNHWTVEKCLLIAHANEFY
jgi:hypothetical protein